MVFLKRNYKILLGIGLLVILVVGIGIAQVFIENKEKLKVKNNLDEIIEEKKQTNERDETVNQLEIITDYINIRSNSNVNSEVVGKVYKGEIYTILEEVGTEFDWYLIETNTGIKGYIAGKSGENVYVNLLPLVNGEPKEELQNENNSTNSNKPNNNNNVIQNNSQNNNIQQNDNIQSNDNQSGGAQQEDNYEPQLPPCLITSCGEGEELKNPNSTDCYCEKIPVEKTPKEKMIEYLELQGYVCTQNHCSITKNEFTSGGDYHYTVSFEINFILKQVTQKTVNFFGDTSLSVYNYKSNTAYGTVTMIGEGTYVVTCSNLTPLTCNATNQAEIEVIHAVRHFQELMKNSGITRYDLINSN